MNSHSFYNFDIFFNIKVQILMSLTLLLWAIFLGKIIFGGRYDNRQVI